MSEVSLPDYNKFRSTTYMHIYEFIQFRLWHSEQWNLVCASLASPSRVLHTQCCVHELRMAYVACAPPVACLYLILKNIIIFFLFIK